MVLSVRATALMCSVMQTRMERSYWPTSCPQYAASYNGPVNVLPIGGATMARSHFMHSNGLVRGIYNVFVNILPKGQWVS